MVSPIVIWWIKRDFRLADNAALSQANASGLPVLPLFCFEPSICASADYSEMHRSAQCEALDTLRKNLQHIGAELYISHDEVCATLNRIAATRPIHAMFSHEETGNDATFQRDRAVAAWCRRHQVSYQEFPQSSVRRGGINRDKLNAHWRQQIILSCQLPTVTRVMMTNTMRESAARTQLPEVTMNPLWQPVSEHAAQKCLSEFLTVRGVRYRGGISSPNSSFEAGSRLSPHLAWGTLTARQVYQATISRLDDLRGDSSAESRRWSASLRAFLSRIHWRDHFIQRLESEPAMEFQALHPLYRALTWENSESHLSAWLDGRTGFPLVDAVMRCLASTGFVNFRMRAMVVSFACHALHLDWRLIHPGLAKIFRDYEAGIHLSQLQMQAGVVGLNTIRIYNPTKQLIDQDPDSHFVRYWIPELRKFSTQQIIEHQSHPLGGEYPNGVVDWASRSKTMRDILYNLKSSPNGVEATRAVFVRHGSRKRQEARSVGSRKNLTKKKREARSGVTRTTQLTLFDE